MQFLCWKMKHYCGVCINLCITVPTNISWTFQTIIHSDKFELPGGKKEIEPAYRHTVISVHVGCLCLTEIQVQPVLLNWVLSSTAQNTLFLVHAICFTSA